jgi:hypothetical protein
MLSLLLLIATPFAQDCDGRALSKKISESSPVRVASIFSELAQCDERRARRAAPEAFGRMIWDSRTTGALKAAIELGENDLVRDWIGQLRSDERSSAVASLGAACAGNEHVANFLTESHDVLGEKFWSQRWYRSLSECRFESVQILLNQVVNETSDDRDRFLGVLEVYARNLGPAAVEKITGLLNENEDEELSVYLVKTYGDASQVGSPEGQDEEATSASVAAILELAPQFTMRTLRQAQTTLLALGAEAESKSLVGAHYRSSKWEDGHLHYGLVAVETARCKGGKKIKLGIHTGDLTEPGHRFPVQVKADALEATRSAWSMRLAEKCKVEQQLEVFVSEIPIGSAEELNAWNRTQVEGLADRVAKKRIETAEELPVSLD